MTEPENPPVPAPVENPTAGGPVADTSAALPFVAQPGAGQILSPAPATPSEGETVLATYEPHTLVLPEHTITSAGVVVPSDKVDEYIEIGRKHHVRVYRKNTGGAQ
jgi:hypothetical protein